MDTGDKMKYFGRLIIFHEPDGSDCSIASNAPSTRTHGQKVPGERQTHTIRSHCLFHDTVRSGNVGNDGSNEEVPQHNTPKNDQE